jgi:hypothetical protein
MLHWRAFNSLTFVWFIIFDSLALSHLEAFFVVALRSKELPINIFPHLLVISLQFILRHVIYHTTETSPTHHVGGQQTVPVLSPQTQPKKSSLSHKL